MTVNRLAPTSTLGYSFAVRTKDPNHCPLGTDSPPLTRARASGLALYLLDLASKDLAGANGDGAHETRADRFLDSVISHVDAEDVFVDMFEQVAVSGESETGVSQSGGAA